MKAPGSYRDTPGLLAEFGVKSLEGLRTTAIDPPVSRDQRRAAAIARKVRRGEMEAMPGSASAHMAQSMTMKELGEVAHGSEKGLPRRKRK